MEAIQDPADVDAYLDLAKGKRIDGLIVINPRKGDTALRKVIESKFPVVVSDLPDIRRKIQSERKMVTPAARQPCTYYHWDISGLPISVMLPCIPTRI